MKTTHTYDHFYLWHEIEAILKGYESDHPELTTLTSLGKTAEGRDIWAIAVTDSATGLRTLLYAVVMTVLYCVSYVIQQRWVFAPQKSK